MHELMRARTCRSEVADIERLATASLNRHKYWLHFDRYHLTQLQHTADRLRHLAEALASPRH